MTRLLLAALVAGVLFGVGLAMSEMTDPQRVLRFLDIFGDFDPALLFVLGGAVAVTSIAFRFVLRQESPVLADTFRSHACAPWIANCSAARRCSASAGASPATARGQRSSGWVCCCGKRCGSCRRWWSAP